MRTWPPNLLPLMILIITSVVCGQDETGSPRDSTNLVPIHPNLRLLPFWVPADTISEAFTLEHLDPLTLTGLTPAKRHTRLPRWVGLGLIATGSVLSYQYHQLAEDAYREYQRSGNPTELNTLFSRAEKYDRLSGWCFVGAEAGLVMLSLSLIFSP